MPLVFLSSEENVKRFNLRKLGELTFHLARAGRLEDLYKQCLFNFDWMYAKVTYTVFLHQHGYYLLILTHFYSFTSLFLALCLSALLSAEWLWRSAEILLRRGQETDQAGGGLPQTGRLSAQLTPSHAWGPAHSQAAARDDRQQQSHPVTDLPGDA